MIVLAIESSSMVAGAAIINDEKLVSEYIVNNRRNHSQTLMPTVEKVLDAADLSIEDIDIFAASSGPGSFTGLRIGISTIKALAQSVDKPVIGVPTLDGLAYNIPYAEGLICPIIDARNEQVYTAVYNWIGGELKRESDYMAVSVLELTDMLKEEKKNVIFNGDGVSKYSSIIQNAMRDHAIFSPAPYREQRPSSIAYIALKKAMVGEVQTYFELVPFYLRKSQAEQNLQKKKAN